MVLMSIPQSAIAQSDTPIPEKDSLRIVKICTQLSKFHYEVATEIGFKMDGCQALRSHFEIGYYPVRGMSISFGYNYGMLQTPVKSRSSHELLGIVGAGLWKSSPLELRAGCGHTVGKTFPKSTIVRGELIFQPRIWYVGVGYQYNFTKDSLVDDYGGLYLKLGINIRG